MLFNIIPEYVTLFKYAPQGIRPKSCDLPCPNDCVEKKWEEWNKEIGRYETYDGVEIECAGNRCTKILVYCYYPRFHHYFLSRYNFIQEMTFISAIVILSSIVIAQLRNYSETGSIRMNAKPLAPTVPAVRDFKNN